jgi:hypothetical protein
MKTIFTPKYVNQGQLFDPCLLVKAIDYLADNTTKGDDYAKLTSTERRVWF